MALIIAEPWHAVNRARCHSRLANSTTLGSRTLQPSPALKRWDSHATGWDPVGPNPTDPPQGWVSSRSGGNTPVKSQPEWLQQLTWFLPSRHYISFAQAVVYRGAGLDIVWPELLVVAVMGLAFLVAALLMFRRAIAASA